MVQAAGQLLEYFLLWIAFLHRIFYMCQGKLVHRLVVSLGWVSNNVCTQCRLFYPLPLLSCSWGSLPLLKFRNIATRTMPSGNIKVPDPKIIHITPNVNITQLAMFKTFLTFIIMHVHCISARVENWYFQSRYARYARYILKSLYSYLVLRNVV